MGDLCDVRRKPCGPIHLHNDGSDFVCMKCGAIAHRTRDNLYPPVIHKPKKRKARGR